MNSTDPAPSPLSLQAARTPIVFGTLRMWRSTFAHALQTAVCLTGHGGRRPPGREATGGGRIPSVPRGPPVPRPGLSISRIFDPPLYLLLLTKQLPRCGWFCHAPGLPRRRRSRRRCGAGCETITACAGSNRLPRTLRFRWSARTPGAPKTTRTLDAFCRATSENECCTSFVLRSRAAPCHWVTVA